MLAYSGSRLTPRYDRCGVILTSFLIGLWRQGNSSGGKITREMALFEERSARTEELLADSERASADLHAATERLRISRARLQVLLASVETAQRRTRWLRVFLPAR